MHFDIGFAGFIAFTAYYIILKALLQFLNIESRRNGGSTLAAVTGLLA